MRITRGHNSVHVNFVDRCNGTYIQNIPVLVFDLYTSTKCHCSAHETGSLTQTADIFILNAERTLFELVLEYSLE